MSKKRSSKKAMSAKARKQARKQLIGDIIMMILVFVIIALCLLIGGEIVKDVVGYAAIALETIELIKKARKVRKDFTKKA